MDTVALAAAAGAASTIGLISHALLATAWPPALPAKEIASIDGVSGGRLSLGSASADPQRMLRTTTHKLVVNPESVNELYDLGDDPYESVNRIDGPQLAGIRRELMTTLYRELRQRGDNFYHWMTSMFEVGGADYDVTLSSFE
jgi:hypothetical protein